MKDKPYVGQIVCLNDGGVRSIHGLTSREMIDQSRRMTVTYVSERSLTNDVDTFDINVDQPLINRFILTHHDVDEVKE